jgi:hypothetical protein
MSRFLSDNARQESQDMTDAFIANKPLTVLCLFNI